MSRVLIRVIAMNCAFVVGFVGGAPDDFAWAEYSCTETNGGTIQCDDAQTNIVFMYVLVHVWLLCACVRARRPPLWLKAVATASR